MRSGVRGAFNLQGNIMGNSPNAGKQWEWHKEEEEEDEDEDEVEEKEDEEV